MYSFTYVYKQKYFWHIYLSLYTKTYYMYIIH